MVCIVIPALNEAAGLRWLLPRLPGRLHGLPVAAVVVSDGSTDGTDRVAAACGALVVRLHPNRGKAAAVRAGIARAEAMGGRAVVTMDGDGQHDPADLPALVGPVVRGECDVALGTRYALDGRRRGVPLNRYLVRRGLVSLLRRRLGRTYSDPCCGYRCFSREALSRLSLAGDRYQGELEAIFDAEAARLRVLEVPVARIYAPGCSKMGARWGRIPGRLGVVWGYGATVWGRTRWRGTGRSPGGAAVRRP